MWPTLFEIPFLHIPIRGYGFMLMVAFLGGTWWATRRAARVKADPDMVVNLGFVALIASVIGARLFYVLHYWDDHFAGRGLWAIVNVTAGGLEFYGGFIGALVAGVGYMLLRKVSVRLYADIAIPSVMFGMGMARIGCFLNGCCWGAPCTSEIPWAVRFPFASPAFSREWEERRVQVPGELIIVNPSGQAYPVPRDWLDELAKSKDPNAGNAAYIAAHAQRFRTSAQEIQRLAGSHDHLSMWVHPAQLYASIGGLLLATLLNTYFYRRKRHGTVFAYFLLFYAIQRFIEEAIRIDNPHDAAGMTISQFVSVAIFLTGVACFLWLRKLPLRSPAAIPYVPPWLEAQPVASTGPKQRQRSKVK